MAALPPHPPAALTGRPGPGPGRVPPRPRSAGLAVAALVTGVLGVLLGPWPVLDQPALLLAVAALTCGTVALATRRPALGMAVAGVATGAVGLVVAVVSLLVWTGLGVLGALVGTVAAGAGEGPADEPVAAVDVGRPVRLDDYTVTVTGIRTGADDLVAAADPANPAPRGEYVVVDLDVTYRGSGGGGEGDAYEDLYGYLDTTDGNSYDALDCDVVLPLDARDLAPLSSGEAASFQMCFDVDPGAGEGALAEVVDSRGEGSWGLWSQPGAAGPAEPDPEEVARV